MSKRRRPPQESGETAEKPAAAGELRALAEAARIRLEAAAAQETDGLSAVETGRVARIDEGVVDIAGLPRARVDELLLFPGGVRGAAWDLSPDRVGAVLLDDALELQVGDPVRRTSAAVSTPVGPALLGRVVDPLGRPLDGGRPIAGARHEPVEKPAPAIMERAPVEQPLLTGVKAVDAVVPIGKGQRQLIIGDRQTGKTAVALDAILAQTRSDALCVYCAISQRGEATSRVIATLKKSGMLERSVVVVAGGEAPPGLRFVAPYAATTMAEHFARRGRDVLVIYDDLTRHARAYRELALLLRRAPGREAFPADVFYSHARLLERAANLAPRAGGGSITALPVVETQAQLLSAYIPTNLISITDGQIYLSPDLFSRGQLPAVDLGKSVSRIGGKAQTPAFRQLAGDLRLSQAQFEELETFSRLGTRLDEATERTLTRGRRVRAALRQNDGAPLGPSAQIAALYGALSGLLDPLDEEKAAPAAAHLAATIEKASPNFAARLDHGEALSPDERETLKQLLSGLLESGGFTNAPQENAHGDA